MSDTLTVSDITNSMGTDGDHDQSLLDRLNALRKTNIQLKPTQSPFTPIASKEASKADDLSSRLAKLRSAALATAQSPTASATSPASASKSQKAKETFSDTENDPLRFDQQDIDDQALDDLLADLGPEDQWQLDPEEPADIKKLLDEARLAIGTAKEKQEESASEGPKVTDPDHHLKTGNSLAPGHDLSAFTEETPSQHQNDADGAEADDIIQRALDEASLEKCRETEIKKPNKADLPHGDDSDEGDEGEENSFTLPSVPSAPPLRSKQSQDFEDSIAARMAALKTSDDDGFNLPSVPTSAPGTKKPTATVAGLEGGGAGIGKLPTYTDADIESWCVICQDDATVECFGCDGDLYCATCWKEGHMGPDAGFEEKTHKWAKYRKPR